MSLTDLITSDVSDVFLSTTEFAESVTRRIAGDSGNTEAQTALVFPVSSEFQSERGEAVSFDYRMELPASDTVTVADSYVLGSDVAEVLKVDKENIGAQTVYLKRVEATTFRGGPRR